MLKNFFGAMFALAAGAVLSFALAIPVLAAEKVGSPGAIYIGEFIASLLPLALDVAGLAVAWLMGWALLVLKSKFNIDIDARHRQALHSAITTGLGVAVAKAGPIVIGTTFDVNSPHVATAVNYALESVPDAINHFGVNSEWLRQMALAKIVEVPAHVSPGVLDIGAAT